MPRTITVPAVPESADLPRLRWTSAQYENLFTMNLLPDGKYELIAGDIVEKMPIKYSHASIISRLFAYFSGFCPYSTLSSAFTLAIDEHNLPEPDFAVLNTETPQLTERGYLQPQDIQLLIEVSDATLARDLTAKANLYARANIAEYWVIDVSGRSLRIHTEPTSNGYSQITEYAENDIIVPLFAPTATTIVSTLLP